MTLQRRISFHVCLGAVLSALIFLLAIGLAGTLGDVAKREVAGPAAANLESVSQQMARELSAGLEQFAQEVQAQASRELFRTPGATPGELRAALEQFVAGRPEYAVIKLADARSGAVLAASSSLFEGTTLDRSVLENAAKGLFLGDVHDETRLAELLPRSPLGEPARFLDVAAPVRNERGQVSRILAAGINWQWADGVRNSVLGPARERRGIELMIVDSSNRIILAPGSLPSGSTLDQAAGRPPGANTKTTP